MPTYEINVNVNGASSGTERKSELEPTSKDQSKSNLSSNLKDKKLTQTKAKALMTSSLAATDTSLAKRAQGLTSGAASYLKNVDKRQVVGGVSTVLGATMFVIQHQAAAASLKGASHKADKLNVAQQGITTAASIGGAFALGGPVAGLAVMVGLAYKTSQENKKFIKAMQLDSARAGYYSRRLISDISERR